jgi:hypothetical protein
MKRKREEKAYVKDAAKRDRVKTPLLDTLRLRAHTPQSSDADILRFERQ